MKIVSNLFTGNSNNLYDLFIGDGVIQGVFFDKGKITFVKHVIKTEKLKYEEKNGKLIVTLHTNKKEIASLAATFERYDYNVLFLSTILIITVFLLFLLFFQSYFNSKTIYFINPIIIPIFITLVNITILVLPCVSIKIGNDYILLRNNDPNYSKGNA